jgi:hypothetical protein
MTKYSFDIPILYDDNYTSDLNSYPNKLQFYGCKSNEFPTGRPNDTESYSQNSFLAQINSIKRGSKEFNYLLNGCIKYVDLEKFEEYLMWVMQLNPDIITFSDPKIYHYLLKKFSFTSFEVSAIVGIKNKSDFLKYISDNNISIKHIRKIVLHHDVTQDVSELSEFTSFLKNNNIIPCVLITESCYYNCPFRKAHYLSCAKAYIEEKYSINYHQVDCVLKRLYNPESLLDLSGFLLPELLDIYNEKTGINNFKLSGRSKSVDWIYNSAKSYLEKKSPENLFDIIVFTTPYLSTYNMDVEDLFYLNSNSYIELYNELSDIVGLQEKYLFLKDRATQLLKNGLLKVNDINSVYDIKNNDIILVKKGEYTQYLEKVGQQKNV